MNRRKLLSWSLSVQKIPECSLTYQNRKTDVHSSGAGHREDPSGGDQVGTKDDADDEPDVARLGAAEVVEERLERRHASSHQERKVAELLRDVAEPRGNGRGNSDHQTLIDGRSDRETIDEIAQTVAEDGHPADRTHFGHAFGQRRAADARRFLGARASSLT